MKKLLLIACIIISGSTASAQTGTWKIKLNTKTLLLTNKEDEVKNCKKVKSAEWKKSGNLEIIFTEDNKDTWIRSFLFNDEEGNQLLTKDSTTYVKIPLVQLRTLFAGKKEIRIYTAVSPLDRNLKIRMRRVHLYTLKLP